METDLYYRLEGSGDILLLLNGVAMSAATWHPVSVRLGQSFRVLGCDLRGQALSPGEPPSEFAGHAADVARLLESQAPGGAYVVGTSFGAAVAAVLAARWPQLVRSLVLVAATDAFDGAMATEVGRWRQACLDVAAGAAPAHLLEVLEPTVYSRAFLAANQGGRAVRRRQLAMMPTTWFKGLAALLASARGASVRGELKSISCPTLVLAAEDDYFIPLDRCRALAEAISGARFEVMAGAGHAIVVEQPEELAGRIVEFLAWSGSA